MSSTRTDNFGSALYHEVAFALHQARQVAPAAAQMIAAAAEAGLIGIEPVTNALLELYGPISDRLRMVAISEVGIVLAVRWDKGHIIPVLDSVTTADQIRSVAIHDPARCGVF